MNSAPTYLESLNQGLHRLMENDPSVVLLGEDLLDPYGGAFKVVRGLSTRFPDRVLGTPISEASIVGVSAGLALRGFRPVAEIMFGDFLLLAADQIVNHATKFSLMYNRAVQVPMVVRMPMGGGRGYGPTHSQSLEKHFLGTPGLTIVAPSSFHDPGRLLGRAVADPSPVLFIEHKLLYPDPLRLESEEGILREEIEEPSGYPTVSLRNYASGTPDATLITYGGGCRHLPGLLTAMREEEIRLLVVLPSALQPVPGETLLQAAGDSLRVVAAEEGTEGFGWGSEIACLIHEGLGSRLKRPVVRVTSGAGVIPASAEGEESFLLNPEKLKSALWRVLS